MEKYIYIIDCLRQNIEANYEIFKKWLELKGLDRFYQSKDFKNNITEDEFYNIKDNFDKYNQELLDIEIEDSKNIKNNGEDVKDILYYNKDKRNDR